MSVENLYCSIGSRGLDIVQMLDKATSSQSMKKENRICGLNHWNILFVLVHGCASTLGFTSPHPVNQFRRDKLECSSAFRVILGVAAAVGVTRGFKIVQQGDVALVERLGKYQSRLNPGFHVIIPLVDRVRTTITQREQVFDIPPQECITSDNAPLSADAVVYWRVVDPEKATYSVVNLEIAIQNLVLTQIRSEIGKLTLDETFSAREKINSILLKDLDIATDPWGVKISRVEVRDIVPNREIMQAMEMQMAAERTKRAVIIKSEGAREKTVNEARGEAESRLIDAKAAAEAVKFEAEAEASKLELEATGAARALGILGTALGSQADAAEFQIMREFIAAKRDLARSENAKVIVTSDAPSDILGKAMAFYESSQPSNE